MWLEQTTATVSERGTKLETPPPHVLSNEIAATTNGCQAIQNAWKSQGAEINHFLEDNEKNF